MKRPTGSTVCNGKKPIKKRLSSDDVVDYDDQENKKNGNDHSDKISEDEIRKLLPCTTNDGKVVVICLDFGVNPDQVKDEHPNVHFCYGCGLFLQEYSIGSSGRKKRMRPNTSAYKCTAMHESLESPTLKKIPLSILKDANEIEEEEDY